MNKLESSITKNEKEAARINQEMSSNGNNASKLMALQADLDKVNKKLEQLYGEYEELSS
jgi:hypothetical protein